MAIGAVAWGAMGNGQLAAPAMGNWLRQQWAMGNWLRQQWAKLLPRPPLGEVFALSSSNSKLTR
ncbi:MAG: hypothetical protein IPN72_08645 [Saprospiraceae bacterium]|nr:hypothetical protein [Saprospiraceae bacterium]